MKLENLVAKGMAAGVLAPLLLAPQWETAAEAAGSPPSSTLGLPADSVIEKEQTADVTGDGVPDGVMSQGDDCCWFQLRLGHVDCQC